MIFFPFKGKYMVYIGWRGIRIWRGRRIK